MFSLPTSHADGLISRCRWPARWTVVGSDSHWTFHASLLRSSFDLTLHYLFIYLFIDVPFSLELSSLVWKTTSDNGTWLHPSSFFFYYFFVPLFFFTLGLNPLRIFTLRLKSVFFSSSSLLWELQIRHFCVAVQFSMFLIISTCPGWRYSCRSVPNFLGVCVLIQDQ